MSRRTLLIPLLLVLLLVASGCRYDYFFLAFEIECLEGDDRCFEVKEWTRFYCTRFVTSPFEIMAGPYDLEFDMDIPDALAGAGRFPRKLQAQLMGYDAEGRRAFRYRSKRWKVNRSTGRVEETFDIKKDLVVPAGGELCFEIKPFGSQIVPGWLAGILLEQAAAS